MIVRDYVKYLETRYDRTDFREPKEKQVAPHYKYVDLSMPYAVVSVLLVYIVCVLIDQARIRFLEKPLFQFIETRNYQKQK